MLPGRLRAAVEAPQIGIPPIAHRLGRTFPFSPSCMSAALTRRQFFVGYAALQFSLDQILDQWHRSLERLRIGEMVVQEGVVQHCAFALCRIVQLKDRSLYCRDSLWPLR